jgi:hypothetical protein
LHPNLSSIPGAGKSAKPSIRSVTPAAAYSADPRGHREGPTGENGLEQRMLAADAPRPAERLHRAGAIGCRRQHDVEFDRARDSPR